MSSINAILAIPSITPYIVSKGGVNQLTKVMALALADKGIRVNAIGPGVIDTPLAAGLAGQEGGAIRSNLEQRTPVGRAGQPADIAALVNFMAGPDGSFMTGSYVIMDGGLRDSRGSTQPGDDVVAESMQIMESSLKRREDLQNLLDDR